VGLCGGGGVLGATAVRARRWLQVAPAALVGQYVSITKTATALGATQVSGVATEDRKNVRSGGLGYFCAKVQQYASKCRLVGACGLHVVMRCGSIRKT